VLPRPHFFTKEIRSLLHGGETENGSPSRSSQSEGWSATRDLHPEGSAILSRRGLLFPLKPVAAKWPAAP